MQPISKISHHWREPGATEPYNTGVSLHSHTSHSIETLNFVQAMCSGFPFANRLLDSMTGAASARATSRWISRPPTGVRHSFRAWPSISSSTRSSPSASRPSSPSPTTTTSRPRYCCATCPARAASLFSVEWTVPFGTTAFHLGIHNLPSADALTWMEVFANFTARPSESALAALLRELNDSPQILVVLNHPAWDLYAIGEAAHNRELSRLLAQNNHLLHALELNGLRHARENRKVEQLARWRQLLISGGDRHGLEPNANLNLTDATSFNNFVDEIRIHRRSHVLYLNQYARPWEQRMLDSTLEAIADHPQFSPGWQRWDERAFHPDNEGVVRPLAELWEDGRPPLPLHLLIQAAKLLRYRRLGQVAAAGFALFGSSDHASSSREIA